MKLSESVAHKLGGRGEDAVRAYLEGLGYEFSAENYFTKYGELDLVMMKGGEAVFVEVKTRKRAAARDPFESINEKKQGRIKKAAEMWLSCQEKEYSCRFDCASVYLPEDGEARILYLEDAFC
ncbi:MAG: YraN family protein [Oscillospiraceae bacterium]|jgi:putative endonuclease|nr:YraN family protein [Oscillospiraceae bacterium]